MVTVTVQLDDGTAQLLDDVAREQNQSREQVIREALVGLSRHRNGPMKGVGAYHSGRSDISERAEEILENAAAEGRWP